MELFTLLSERINDVATNKPALYFQLVVLIPLLALLIYDYITGKNNQFEKRISYMLGEGKGKFNLSLLNQKLSHLMKDKEKDIELELVRANLDFKTKEYISFLFIGAAVGSLVGFILIPFAFIFKSPFFFIDSSILKLTLARFLAAGAMGYAGSWFPKIWVRYLIIKRKRMLTSQLQDALMNIADALSTGQTIQQAIESVGAEMPYPMGNEFRIVSSEIDTGKDFASAMKSLKERVNIADMDMASDAIEISHISGGELEDLLRGMVHILQERFDTRQEIAKSIATAKMTGIILLCAPIAFYVMFSSMGATSYGAMFTSIIGLALVAVGVGLYVLAAWLIFLIVRYASKDV